MGEIEVYEILKEFRLKGDDRFKTIKDIEKIMIERELPNYRNVYRNLNSLTRLGYLDFELNTNFKAWRRIYRLKDKYLER